MKLPWSKRRRTDRLVIGLDDAALVWVHAQGRQLLACGLEQRGSDTPAAFAKRVRALGLPDCEAIALLPLAQSQLLQIEAPPVPADELKAAARWRIKDMVELDLDELTLDVLRVGDGRSRAAQQLFVAAAPSALVQATGEWARSAGLQLRVIDIRETAQRNLQSAAAGPARERAGAALVMHGTQALLTISAGGELYHARRIEGEALPAAPAPGAAPAPPPLPDFDALDIVDYGAEPDGAPAQEQVPRLVIELQRSLDLWERSWPALPLAGVLVHAGTQTDALVALLQRSLGQPVHALDAAALFDGYAEFDAALREAVLPLLGGLLRDAVISA